MRLPWVMPATRPTTSGTKIPIATAASRPSATNGCAKSSRRRSWSASTCAGLEQKANFLLQGGCDMIHADPEYDMGITGALKIAHLCEALGLDVQIHACGPAHRVVIAAMRNTHFYEMALMGPGMPNMIPPGLHLWLLRSTRRSGQGWLRPRPRWARVGRELRLGGLSSATGRGCLFTGNNKA